MIQSRGSYGLLLNLATLDIALEVPIPIAANVARMPPVLGLGRLAYKVAHRYAFFADEGCVLASLPLAHQVQGLTGGLTEVHTSPAGFGVVDGWVAGRW